MITDAKAWAEQLFGASELGDVRRTRRLVAMGEQVARHTGQSLCRACRGDEAAKEGAYRFVRSPHVEVEAVRESGYAATVRAARPSRCVLATEDTTTLSYRHGASRELGDLGGKASSQARGVWVHSVLLVDADTECTLGLVEQEDWTRETSKRGQTANRRQRAHEDKESYKWQRASERVAMRLGETMTRTIAVCDREADVLAYLHYKNQRGERFLVRAAQDRRLEEAERTLLARIRQAPVCGTSRIRVPQRGGRPAREAVLNLRYTTATLRPPATADASVAPVPVTLVQAEEKDATADGLSWLLLSSEPVRSPEEARELLRYYSLRWRIEEFHKAWKTGAGVEQLRMQGVDNLRRMAAVLAFAAVRLLQLRETLMVAHAARRPCTEVLDTAEWRVLWGSTQRHTKPPKVPPNLAWAYQALARLGGFLDTKRTGRASWQTLWEGWFRLQDRVEGYRLSREAVSGSEI